MPTTDLSVNLRLNDELSRALDQVKAKVNSVSGAVQTSFRRAGVSVDSLKAKMKTFATTFRDNWLKITAAITASIFAIRKAFELIQLSAKFEQQRQAFRNLASSMGADADEIIRKLRQMSGETLSTSQIMQQASRAMVLGLETSQLPRLMEISRAAARAFGEDVDFMFQSIVLGIGRQSRMILDNLGIIVKAETAYENYATTLNKNVKELTDMEKRQAFANAVMQAGENIIKRVNVQQKTQLENLQSLSAFWEDLRIKIGNFLITVIRMFSALFNMLEVGIFNVFTFFSENINRMIENLLKLSRSLDDFAKKIPILNQLSSNLTASLESLSIKTDIFTDRLRQTRDSFAETTVEISNLIRGTTKQAIQDSTKEIAEGMKDAVSGLGDALSQAEAINENFGRAAAGIAMAMAIINTAEGVTRALKDYPWPFSLVVGSIIAAAGAIQVATIAATRFHQGGMIKAHDGLAVDEVPIIAQTGEGILSRRGMQALGGAGNLNRLNAGQPIVSGGINIQIFNPKVTSREETERLANILGVEIERELKFARGL